MNNKKSYLMIGGLFLLSFILSGCSKDIPINDDDYVYIRTSQSPTKSIFIDNKISFKFGDSIGLKIKDVITIEMYNRNNPDENCFSGRYKRQDPGIEETDYYFYYPYTDTQDDEFNIELNPRQRAPFDNDQTYMFAEAIHDKYDESDMPSLAPVFHQMFGIVSISIINDEDQYQEEVIKGISLSADEEIVGSFNYCVSEPGKVDPIQGKTTNTVYSFFPEITKIGKGTVHKVYVQLNPETLHNVKIKVYTDKHIFTSTGSKTIIAAQDKIIKLNQIKISDMNSEAVTHKSKSLVCWGDSATVQGEYPRQLCNLLGPDYTFYNRGVGGDNSIDIAARQGGIPMFLLEDAIVKDGQSTELKKGIFINKNIAFETTNVLLALYVSGRIEWPLSFINPVRINGKEYNLTSFHSLEKVSQTGAVDIIPSGSIIEPYDSYTYKDADLAVIYIGLNGLFETTESLIGQIDAMCDHLDKSNCLILGFHNGKATAEYVDKMKAHFGRKFIDLRNIVHDNYAEMLVKAGVYDSIEDVVGSIDEQSIKEGAIWPRSFMKSDNLHFTNAGGKVIALLAYDRMQELGYLDD